MGRDGRRCPPRAIPHHGIEHTARPAAIAWSLSLPWTSIIGPSSWYRAHGRPAAIAWSLSLPWTIIIGPSWTAGASQHMRRGDGHQEPLDRRGNHPPRGLAPLRGAPGGDGGHTGPEAAGMDRRSSTGHWPGRLRPRKGGGGPTSSGELGLGVPQSPHGRGCATGSAGAPAREATTPKAGAEPGTVSRETPASPAPRGRGRDHGAGTRVRTPERRRAAARGGIRCPTGP